MSRTVGDCRCSSLSQLDVRGTWQGIFGRLSLGVRHGFSATTGADSGELHIDTLNSSYGAGWKREAASCAQGTALLRAVPRTVRVVPVSSLRPPAPASDIA